MTNKRPPVPDARLMTAASFVRDGAYIADIGTDHAYLPIWLCSVGKIRGAVVSDINEGPIERAATHIHNFGLDGRITAIRTDGLHGINEYHPEDIIIFGMGGELIIKILSEAEWIKAPALRLILQPMTRAEELREYLNANGFCISDEMLSRDGNRIYQTIYVGYAPDADVTPYSDIELLVGRVNIGRGGELFDFFLSNTQRVMETIRKGKAASGIDTEYEDRIIEAVGIIRKEKK